MRKMRWKEYWCLQPLVESFTTGSAFCSSERAIFSLFCRGIGVLPPRAALRLLLGGLVPEVSTARYRKSVLLGTETRYRSVLELGINTRMVRNKDKAAACHRKDPAWKYSTQVDIGGSDKTYVYLKCNYCDKVVKGGVTRMKEHLSGSHKNVAPCSKVPDTIREEIKSYMNKSTTSKHLAQKQFEDRVDVGSYYGSERSVRDSSSSMKPISSRGARGPMDHYMVDTSEDTPPTTQKMAPENAREARRRVCKDIGRFFYENAIPFNVATSPAYYNMIRSVGAFGRGFKPPTMYDLRTWILKELESTDKSIEEIKRTWAQTGVTIMRLRDRNLKKKGLMDHEDPLLCEDVVSDDEWFIDDEVEVMSSELQDEDLNVDFFDGLKASTSTTIQEQNKKGKRKITEIEEGVDWETLDSIEEEGERAVQHNDDSNEDPLSDDSADDL
ncbi:hypothetical protein M5K25_008434 [Dendrobium thyrsiflorum]|uniref:BED-type domain-containing protein n=2 Tax=Dendrobium thyrsiflorum TaxID=117978 RepID=A0ABD0V8K8_DENTH